MGPRDKQKTPATGFSAPTLSLVEYVKIATGQSFGARKDGIRGPRLRKGRMNRVLLYNGCFNPPHHGHLAHLIHAYRYAGGFDSLGDSGSGHSTAAKNNDDGGGDGSSGSRSEDAVIGAIILVAPDVYLSYKFPTHKKNLHLPENQRIELWETALSHPQVNAREWCAVIPESDWMTVESELEDLCAGDGVQVEYVRLAGGDKVSRRLVEHGAWGCVVTVTADVSRGVDFCERDGDGYRLHRIKGHGEWKRAVQDDDDDDGDTGEGKKKGRRDVWTCSHAKRRDRELLFVTSREDERVDPNVSSTEVRRIISDVVSTSTTYAYTAQQTQDLLEKELSGVALSSELLARYIVEVPSFFVEKGWTSC
ncbi:uncharacterized protein F4822DRAFT_433975 [Hypoxylon trugodes]|uniref:uncharacterized protein n=1 Tax=Hypoxylon trugodes TaxID=326681 RepID=UPI0021969626|nr:uncharacterized protein F4822DRAFT_433975 [Hypoxylon trugodes]KAI1384025.1 hypothetical protein F4822DRAFT_433975 [Hypoxylon trugodes]